MEEKLPTELIQFPPTNRQQIIFHVNLSLHLTTSPLYHTILVINPGLKQQHVSTLNRHKTVKWPFPQPKEIINQRKKLNIFHVFINLGHDTVCSGQFRPSFIIHLCYTYHSQKSVDKKKQIQT